MINERTAIVHDWFQGYHGSERVVDAMRSSLFPVGNEPDIYTFHAARELLPDPLAAAIVKESRLASLPGIRQRGHHPGRWRYLLPYMPRYFSRLRLNRYGLVISSSHACAVNVHPRPGALHICYCYTPMRYAWLPGTERDRVPGLRGDALRVVAKGLRDRDAAAASRPESYIAISEAVRDRIARFYGRDAIVIHPPVELDEFAHRLPKERTHFLWVQRLVAYKHPLEVAEAFRNTPFTLTMVGVGPLERVLRARMPPNVELRGWLPRAELTRLFARAGGFVHAGEEDFGITMVEALGAGMPVVALGRGGALDIVRDGIEGILIADRSPRSIREAIAAVAGRTWDPDALRARARLFSRERFVARLSGHLDALLERRAPRAVTVA